MLRYGESNPPVAPAPCEWCAKKNVVCRATSGKGCFHCVVRWRRTCSLSTSGRAKRGRADDTVTDGSARKKKKGKSSTRQQQRQQRQQQQLQQQQQRPTARHRRAPGPGEAGPSNFAGSFDDTREEVSEHESDDELSYSIAVMSRDLRQFERWAASMSSAARSITAAAQSMSSVTREMRQRLQELEETSRKGKEKQGKRN